MQPTLRLLWRHGRKSTRLTKHSSRRYDACKRRVTTVPISTAFTPLPPAPSASDIPTMTTPIAQPSRSPTEPATVVKKNDNVEPKDAELIFRTVWQDMLIKHGEDNLSFPKDMLFLAGAPGSGKAQMTRTILEFRGITSPPIEVSSLLTSVEALQMKAEGKLVGDRQVISLLLEKLLAPEYQSGVLVDGFPRTKNQAECIRLLYDAMNALRRKYANTPSYQRFRRPIFHIVVLYIDQDESVRRQLRRGKLAQQHNEIVAQTGIGQFKPVRDTDLSSDLASQRYRQFKDQVYESLKIVKDKFAFHFINAEGSPAEVQQRIVKELEYQSSLELGDDTFESLRRIPLASEIILHARHELVKRLDNYRQRHTLLFDKVISILMTEFMHIIKRQALSGRAIIRTQNILFQQEGMAVDMALDLLCERGYTVVLDVNKQQILHRVLPDGRAVTSETKVYEFQIDFPRPAIRRG